MFSWSSRPVLVVTLAFATVLGSLQLERQTNAGPSDYAFLQPWFQVEQQDREKLVQRGVVVRGLPAGDQQLGVIVACAVAISPDEFVRRVRTAGDVKRPELLAGRFDDPPALENLAELSLDEGDLDRLRLCRPGDCRLNLADHEISAVQLALATTARGTSTEAQQAFRRVVLDRVRRYQSRGLKALPDYHDRSEPVRPAAVFSEIIQSTPYLKTHLPGVAVHLEQFPFARTDGAESSLLWSKVMINKKAVVMVNHLTIFRPEAGPRVPTVLVAGTQVYASRYMNGELTLTMLFVGGPGSSNYLVHVERSDLDELGGRFSGLKRAVIEGGIKAEAGEALAALRDRLERGR